MNEPQLIYPSPTYQTIRKSFEPNDECVREVLLYLHRPIRDSWEAFSPTMPQNQAQHKYSKIVVLLYRSLQHITDVEPGGDFEQHLDDYVADKLFYITHRVLKADKLGEE